MHNLDKVQDYIKAHAKYDTQRNYLGMSGIGRCPRQLYENFLSPTQPTEETYRSCYLGYLWEREAKIILQGAGVFEFDSERELIAPFDPRFIGHTDGETAQGDLLEIKSVTQRAMDKIKSENRIKRAHFYQVQTYLRYGDYRQALVTLVCRDPMEFHFIPVPRVESVGESMERKAKTVLAAIDARSRPACECGYCGVSKSFSGASCTNAPLRQ